MSDNMDCPDIDALSDALVQEYLKTGGQVSGYALPSESPANNIRNALQIVKGLQASPQTVAVEQGLEGIEQRLRTALAQLEVTK